MGSKDLHNSHCVSFEALIPIKINFQSHFSGNFVNSSFYHEFGMNMQSLTLHI